MSLFTKLPSQFYNVTAFDAVSLDRDFHLGSAKGMVWLSQLAYAGRTWPDRRMKQHLQKIPRPIFGLLSIASIKA